MKTDSIKLFAHLDAVESSPLPTAIATAAMQMDLEMFGRLVAGQGSSEASITEEMQDFAQWAKFEAAN